MHVFTYGYADVSRGLADRGGRSFETVEGPAGFEIFRVRDAVFPGHCRGAAVARGVRGVVYLDVDEASVARLDRFEGRLSTSGRALAIDCSDGEQRMAEAYVVPPANRSMC